MQDAGWVGEADEWPLSFEELKNYQMIQSILIELLTGNLRKLIDELQQYPDERRIWVTDKQISNAAGNLCLHLAGNLNHFIGATLGNTGYQRNRDAEFSLKDIPRSELISGLEATILMIDKTLPAITNEQLQQDFPLQWNNRTVSVEFMLIHLSGHLAYHLGQVNYHRRLLS